MTRNLELYSQICAAQDGCASLPRMEELLRAACGLTPGYPLPVDGSVAAAPVPLPTPAPDPQPRQVREPQPRPECVKLAELPRETVRQLQRGLHSANQQPGQADGIPGPATRRALDAYHSTNGLPACEDSTREALEQLLRLAPEDANGCPQLLADPAELQRRWERTLDRLALHREAQRDLRRIREQLENDRFWVGRWREQTAIILGGLDAAGSLLENLLLVNPATRKQSILFMSVRVVSRRMLEQVRAGKTIFEAIDKEWEQFYFEFLMERVAEDSGVVSSFKTVWDLTNDISRVAALPEDFSRARRELASAIGRLDREIDKVDARLREDRAVMEAVTRMREAADMACVEAMQSTRPTLQRP